MSLVAIQVPNPAAGADWLATVPAQYTWRPLSIVSTWTTSATGAPITTMTDSSGNARNGAYVTVAGGGPGSVPGAISGDGAIQFGTGQGIIQAQGYATFPPTMIDWRNDWTVGLWVQNFDPLTVTSILLQVNNGATWHAELSRSTAATGRLQFAFTQGAIRSWITAANTIADDQAWHFCVVVKSGTSITLYVNGYVATLTTTDTMPAVTGNANNAGIGGDTTFSAECFSSVDECFIVGSALTAAQITNLWLASSQSFAAWSAAVLARAPAAWYKLDQGPPSSDRKTALVITDGTRIVESIVAQPTMPAGVSIGVNWQTDIPGYTSDSGGFNFYAPMPDRTLPGGYTIGVQTLGMYQSDTWTGVTLWVDQQDALAPFPPAKYFDAHLVLVPKGVG